MLGLFALVLRQREIASARLPRAPATQKVQNIMTWYSSIGTSSPQQQASLDCNGEDLFRFTRGRFVVDEKHEMTMRYKRFNPAELGRVAAKALESRQCMIIEKHADIACNRVFLLTMDDGKEAIAKLPLPASRRPHYITASEVATMEYAREYLHTPTPKVLAWCSRAEQTSVEAEYIIMEKASGVPLANFYRTMDVWDWYAVIQAVARLRARWTDEHFAGYGSIYFTSDLGEKERVQAARKQRTDRLRQRTMYARALTSVGYVVSLTFAGTTATQYLEAIGHRERACVERAIRLPFALMTLYGPGTAHRSRERKLCAIQLYLDLLTTITPRDDAARRPCLWHGDLHIDNIFVDPDNPTKITSIIDWQSVEIAPLFAQVREPHFLEYEGPQRKVLALPELPDHHNELPADKKRQATPHFNLASLAALYRHWIHAYNADAWKCLEFQDTPSYRLLLLARRLFVDGEALYIAAVLDLVDSRPDLLDHDIPKFTKAERVKLESDAEAAVRGIEAMSGIKDALGDLFPEKGYVVGVEEYDRVKDALLQMREQVIEQCATTEEERQTWLKVWPWSD